MGAAVAKWLSSWLAEQEDRGLIPGLTTWIFRDWLSPASKSRYDWKIAESTLILKTTNPCPNTLIWFAFVTWYVHFYKSENFSFRYSYMIDNIILLITGILHQRPISELIPKCHPLGSFEQMEAIHIASTPAELYNAVLVDTPIGRLKDLYHHIFQVDNNLFKINFNTVAFNIQLSGWSVS